MDLCTDAASSCKKRRDRNRKVKCTLWKMAQNANADREHGMQSSGVDDPHFIRIVMEEMSKILEEMVEKAVVARFELERAAVQSGHVQVRSICSSSPFWTSSLSSADAVENFEGSGPVSRTSESPLVSGTVVLSNSVDAGCLAVKSVGEEDKAAKGLAPVSFPTALAESGCEEDEKETTEGEVDSVFEEYTEDFEDMCIEPCPFDVQSRKWPFLTVRDELAYVACSPSALKIWDG